MKYIFCFFFPLLSVLTRMFAFFRSSSKSSVSLGFHLFRSNDILLRVLSRSRMEARNRSASKCMLALPSGCLSPIIVDTSGVTGRDACAGPQETKSAPVIRNVQNRPLPFSGFDNGVVCLQKKSHSRDRTLFFPLTRPLAAPRNDSTNRCPLSGEFPVGRLRCLIRSPWLKSRKIARMPIVFHIRTITALLKERDRKQFDGQERVAAREAKIT